MVVVDQTLVALRLQLDQLVALAVPAPAGEAVAAWSKADARTVRNPLTGAQ